MHDAAALKGLKGQISKLKNEVCELAGDEPRTRGRLRSLAGKLGNIPRPLLRGAEALGGATLASANGLVAIKTAGGSILLEIKTGIGSFGTGLAMMFRAAKGK